MAGSDETMKDRLAGVAQLADPARVTLETYSTALRELRAVALDARNRIERAASTIVDARAFARRRRRRMSRITPDTVE